MNSKHQPFPPGLVASLYLVRQQGEGHILDDLGLSGIWASHVETPEASKFLTYFIDLLENPERSGTHFFGQHRYTTTAKELLQLCLCSHHKFPKGAMESTRHNKVLLRNKPWAWKARLGIHSRIRTAMRHVTVRRWKSLTARNTSIYQHITFPQGFSGHENYQFLAYQWRLDLLPILLEKSAISSELADVLRTRTFTKMAQRFPRRMRLAREAIEDYLLRVEHSAVGDP